MYCSRGSNARGEDLSPVPLFTPGDAPTAIGLTMRAGSNPSQRLLRLWCVTWGWWRVFQRGKCLGGSGDRDGVRESSLDGREG